MFRDKYGNYGQPTNQRLSNSDESRRKSSTVGVFEVGLSN